MRLSLCGTIKSNALQAFFRWKFAVDRYKKAARTVRGYIERGEKMKVGAAWRIWADYKKRECWRLDQEVKGKISSGG